MPGTWACLRIPRDLYDRWVIQEKRLAHALDLDTERKSSRVDIIEQVIMHFEHLTDDTIERMIGGK